MTQPIPQPRIDTLVTDAVSGSQLRRTEYSGTLWFGGRPNTSGRVVAFASTYVRDAPPFFLPDSLPYRSDALADAVVSCSAALQGGGSDINLVTDAQAGWAPDPRGGDVSWLQVRLDVYGREPFAVAYRVVALCDPAAVAQA